ncbi:hypothetical protein [Thermocoleostomius sinensis]|uniref:Uncharacterized protein n=1 Tax=Thermocoleostomius sinensis A174 TaxID=2016057 RepID=A0A9E8ZF85_9CYAN|nr:hypothetical protein [Thermocoleostomius sinensis]WAL62275.1 hypothetical protein OXH18_09880 [Thermocoleostomius sinensis A174]
MSPVQMPTRILLSLSTAPLLLILISSRTIAHWLQEMGQTSEEIFRGDRLPILKISPRQEK